MDMLVLLMEQPVSRMAISVNSFLSSSLSQIVWLFFFLVHSYFHFKHYIESCYLIHREICFTESY